MTAPSHLTDAQYRRELRAALVVRDHGPGLTDADDRAAAWAELHAARLADRAALASLPGGDAA